MSFAEKSPVSTLKELCDQEKGVLMHEFLPFELNAKTFICEVNAFDVFAKGEGRTKKMAKHKACENLLSQLVKMNRFADKLSKITSIPQISANGDTEIGAQPCLSLAKTNVKETGDIASNTKNSEQFANRAILNIVQNDLQSESRTPLELPKHLFNKYRELRAPTNIQSAPLTLSDRHNFFLRLPQENQIRAREILLDQSGTFSKTNKEKVNLTCNALELRHKFQKMGKSQSNYRTFSLEGDYDCVIMGKIPDLYDRIIDYFKIMLNIQSY